jgi:hypothetical protein
LDYVSDDRDPDYWRPYVGQSSNTEQRIAQHVRAIRTGDTDTLHYFVIRRGDGHRTANFVRLWTVSLPESVDPAINTALNNILEMIMARSFQSLPLFQRAQYYLASSPRTQPIAMGPIPIVSAAPTVNG